MTSGTSTLFPSERCATRAVDRVAITLTEFDQRRYLRLINARGETIRTVVAELRAALGLTTALDAGCGIGFFAQILQECGLSVGAFDARMENVLEARKRFRRSRSNKAISKAREFLRWANSISLYVLDCCITWRIRCSRFGTCGHSRAKDYCWRACASRGTAREWCGARSLRRRIRA